jgi:hypothetical protein
MYSPKIKEDLVPYLYEIAKRQRKPMTKVVDEILREQVIHLYDAEKESEVKENDRERTRQ